ncbi:hypothetical protein D0T49_03500 [Paludibacter sp. 221]|uniref:hypothetical protein n=1 Tax=Paludibacter sp. 221 TaxID=2302939 RepID=UPI0013D69813|nr:hypothetical protein [Paludibacter sp. 221]NDV46106.1 hypothetical protein [Paludibacter sp. 221]
MILFFIYTHDLIQQLVKQETSLLAERRFTELKDGSKESLFDKLVMDEEYDVLFRRLFGEAHADIITKIPVNYLADTPTDLEPVYREFPDFSVDRDFNLYLEMHNDFPLQFRKSIDIKIQQYLIDNICYRWLETKSPNDAATYYSRLDKAIEDIKSLLIRRTTPLRRKPSFP